MKLPDSFSFTQQNLQDYSDCRRRFYLRYILKQEWPTIESEPVRDQEALILLGERFHQMAQQLFAGVPSQVIESTIDDPNLLNWWQQFLRLGVQSGDGLKLSEIAYSVHLEGYRLIAKFDLLVYTAGNQLVIFDWKTSQRPPNRKILGNRMQTRVYPFVIAQISQQKHSPFSLSSDQIEMIYWYPAFPELTIQFGYSDAKFNEDKLFLQTLIREILSLETADFSKTENEKLCKYCKYRSLCDRGIAAGDRGESEELLDDISSAFDIDFDQVAAAD
ncbi:MAG: PD-(D/E)XK nuclease family protein [Anaerolineaceae bacterium]